MWERICSSPGSSARFAVAESAGRPVGIGGAGASRDDRPARDRELWFLYLLEREHGSGAGQALLDEVLGTDPASLWVLEGNARAIAFYERNGFTADGGRRPAAFAGAGDELSMLR
jgi:GNAT superfamily N-acetyltransferase